MSSDDQLPDVLAGSTDRLKNMGETGTGMPGVMPASMSRSLNINSQDNGLELAMEMNPKMTSSMTNSTTSLNKQPRRAYAHRSRVDLANKEKEREDKIRRMRELQEEQRKKKLEELKQHALHAQKFREQQEMERRRHIEELRSRDMDRRAQVEERRREIERSEQERRVNILAKNRERAEKIESLRRNSRGHLDTLAFGSSAPRLMEVHRDSSSWATRSTYDRRSSERELDLKSKRTTSAQGLDRNTEGDDTTTPTSSTHHLAQSIHASVLPTAHRRRTDLLPAVMHSGSGSLRGSGYIRTGTTNTPGLSRENSCAAGGSRPSSAMSGHGGAGGRGLSAQVRLRPNTAGRRPRPLSIATTGMTSSMYEERGHKPSLRNKASATPKLDRSKRARSINGEQLEEDQRSNGSSCGPVNSNPVRPSSARKTPAQVKAENAARRAKMTSKPKLDMGGSAASSVHNSTELLQQQNKMAPTSDFPPNSAGGGEGEEGMGGTERQITPDIIKGQDSSKSESLDDKDIEGNRDVGEEMVDNSNANHMETEPSNGDKVEDKTSVPPVPAERKIITSEEEAKARIAAKRKEMKEKMEREAEIERLRLEAIAKEEEEKRLAEEEEERRMIEETERLAAEARRLEEERIEKAMAEAAERARLEREEEERVRAEKEEAERKTQEEAERREKELAELEEKRRIEEEERLRRKARVEAIMARTRGKGGSGTPTGTPKKETPGGDATDDKDSTSQNSQPASLDTNVDPTKPDLLGDITDSTARDTNDSDHQKSSTTQEEGDDDAKELMIDINQNNHMNNSSSSSSNKIVIQNGDGEEHDGTTAKDITTTTTTNNHENENGDGGGEDDNNKEDGVEKGALDSISNKSCSDNSSVMELSGENEASALNKISSNHSPLIEVDNGKISALENDFDQILDLSAERRSGGEGLDNGPPQPPILAFEATTQPQADLLS